MGFALAASALEYNNAENLAFRPNWNISASAGTTIYVAEGNEFWNPNKLCTLSFKENGGFIARMGAGYNYTPVIGINGLLSYAVLKWPDRRFKNLDGSFKEVVFNAGNATIDLSINISNWWAGYNAKRWVNFIAFAGGGVAYRPKGDFPTKLFSGIVRGGGQANLRLSPKLDISCALQGNLVSDQFNGFVVNTPFELQAGLTLGFVYHFQK